MSTLKERLKAARLRSGLSQKEIGERAGISAAVIGHYETGYRRPKYSTLERIAKAMGLEVDCFLEDHDDPDVQKLLIEDFCGSSYELTIKLRAVGWSEETTNQNTFVLRSGDGETINVTEEELKQLDRETDSFMLYKIQELRSKKV